MEKPAPFQNRFGTSAKFSDAGQREIAARYEDRMIARGIPIIKDTKEEDQEDKPKWRGDHSFSTDAASYSLMHFIEPEIAKEHPDWQPEKIKSEARERFTRRLAQDLSYEHKETTHEETTVRWQPIVTGSGRIELATEYGGGMVTLRELWDHTREYAAFVGNPAAYNREEEQAQMAMQEQFLNGSSTEFVSVLSHPDSIRYVQVWQKNADGDVVSKQVDLYKTTGRDFSKDEGKRLIEHLAIFHGVVTPESKAADSQYAHFFTDRAPISESSIRIIATGFDAARFIPEKHGTETTTSLFMDSVKIQKDTKDSVVLLGKYVAETIQEKIQKLIRNGEVNGKKRKESAVSEHQTRTAHIYKEKNGSVKQAEIKSVAGGQPDVFKPIIAEWMISRTMLQHAKDTPAGAPAVLFWFVSLEQHNKKSEVTETNEKQQEQTDFKIGNPQKEKKEQRNFLGKVKERFLMILPARLMKIFSPHLTDIPATSKQTEGPTDVVQPSAEKHTMERRIREVTQKSVRTFIETVSKLIPYRLRNIRLNERQHPLRVHEQTNAPPVSIKESFSRPKEIRTLYEAIVVWFTVSAVTTERSVFIDFVMYTAATVYERIAPGSVRKERKENANAPETLWILLGIIRYLALIRESGKPNSSPAKRAKRDNKGKNRRFGPLFFNLSPMGFSRSVKFAFVS